MKKVVQLKSKQNESDHVHAEQNVWGDWLSAHPEEQSLSAPLATNPDSKQFLETFWPLSNRYVSPIDSLFLVEVLNLTSLNTRSVWLVRDGLIGLLWFFKKFPQPKGFQSRFLIHEEWGPFVPAPWRPFCGTWQICQTNLTTKPQKLMITGLLMDTYANLKDLKLQMEHLSSLLEQKGLSDCEKVLVLPCRTLNYTLESEQTFHIRALQIIAAKIGFKFDSWSLNKFESQDHLNGYALWEISDKRVISDSSLVQTALKKGAQILGSDVVDPIEENDFITLSPYHGLKIKKSIPGEPVKMGLSHGDKSFLKTYHEKYLHTVTSEAYQKLPWPRWFADWVQGGFPAKK